MQQSATEVRNLHLPLRALAALFDPAAEQELLSAILQSIRDVVTFDQALALVEAAERLALRHGVSRRSDRLELAERAFL